MNQSEEPVAHPVVYVTDLWIRIKASLGHKLTGFQPHLLPLAALPCKPC